MVKKCKEMVMPRVLLVDDEPLCLMVLEEVLCDLPVELVSCRSGEAALDQLRAAGASIDLVIMDQMMPGLSGTEVLRAMRRDPALAAIPVILESAVAEPAAIRDISAAGADEYLVKPASAAEVLRLVRKHLPALVD